MNLQNKKVQMMMLKVKRKKNQLLKCLRKRERPVINKLLTLSLRVLMARK